MQNSLRIWIWAKVKRNALRMDVAFECLVSFRLCSILRPTFALASKCSRTKTQTAYLMRANEFCTMWLSNCITFEASRLCLWHAHSPIVQENTLFHDTKTSSMEWPLFSNQTRTCFWDQRRFCFLFCFCFCFCFVFVFCFCFVFVFVFVSVFCIARISQELLQQQCSQNKIWFYFFHFKFQTKKKLIQN